MLTAPLPMVGRMRGNGVGWVSIVVEHVGRGVVRPGLDGAAGAAGRGAGCGACAPAAAGSSRARISVRRAPGEVCGPSSGPEMLKLGVPELETPGLEMPGLEGDAAARCPAAAVLVAGTRGRTMGWRRP